MHDLRGVFSFSFPSSLFAREFLLLLYSWRLDPLHLSVRSFNFTLKVGYIKPYISSLNHLKPACWLMAKYPDSI